MVTDNWFEDLLAERSEDPDFQTEELLLDITEQIHARLNQLQLRPVDLAQQLGISRAAVSQLLNGRPNMTIRKLVGIANALDQRVHVTLRPRTSERLLSREFTHRVNWSLPSMGDGRSPIAMAA